MTGVGHFGKDTSVLAVPAAEPAPRSPELDHGAGDLIRAALFAAGKGRAAGVIDVQIAATAVHHHATVLHYDSDYDHIHDAYPQLSTRWVVPRDTTDWQSTPGENREHSELPKPSRRRSRFCATVRLPVVVPAARDRGRG